MSLRFFVSPLQGGPDNLQVIPISAVENRIDQLVKLFPLHTASTSDDETPDFDILDPGRRPEASCRWGTSPCPDIIHAAANRVRICSFGRRYSREKITR
jgi:hypothetical protein